LKTQYQMSTDCCPNKFDRREADQGNSLRTVPKIARALQDEIVSILLLHKFTYRKASRERRKEMRMFSIPAGNDHI